MTSIPTLEEVALAWAIRTADAEFRDWDAFIAWLDGDPARNLAYNRAAMLVADGAGAPARTTMPTAEVVVLAERQVTPARSTSRRWLAAAAGLALAAGVAGVLVIDRAGDAPAWRTIDTMAGRPRTIDLVDGSRIDLAGGSRLRIDPARPRHARLDRGRAVFVVRHDPAAPFEVLAGRHRALDAGTTFEVAQEDGRTRVAVAEGLVIVDPGPARLRLEPGRAAVLAAGRPAEVERIAPDQVGQWRNERMTYNDAPLSMVVGDLATALGQPITVDERAGRRRFNGTITPMTVRGKPEEAAALLGVRVVASARGWEFFAP